MSRLFAALSAVVLSTVALSCEAADESASQSSNPAPSAVAEPEEHAGAGVGPIYQTPVQLVPGEYKSPASAPGAWDAGVAAQAEDEDKPRFEGRVNGIRLYTYGNPDPAARKLVCGGGKYVRYDEVSELSFQYLLPGTRAWTPQAAAVCEDGSIAGFGQHFSTATSSFDIWYSRGERAFPHSASAARVSEGTVSGQEAVLIRPVNQEGFGESWIAWATPNGIIVISAWQMPFEETLRIAEGVKCAGC